jgi:hypothetical protein
MCLNSTCFCDQEYTSEDCSMTYKKYLNQGYVLTDFIMYLIITFGVSLLLTLIYLLIKRSKRVTGDYLELEE